MSDKIIHIRAEPKTVVDFAYLPGTTNKERFEQVVALGLRHSEIDPEPVAPPIASKRALLDNIMAQHSQSVTSSALPDFSLGRTLKDFSVDEIIAHVCTWKRVPTGKLVAALQAHIAAEEWAF
jgi:hypothetical protein